MKDEVNQYMNKAEHAIKLAEKLMEDGFVSDAV